MGGRGRGPRTRGSGGGVGEAGEEIPGPGGWEEGWGRQGKESLDQGVGRRGRGDRGRNPWTRGSGGGVGKAGEGIPGPGGREEG